MSGEEKEFHPSIYCPRSACQQVHMPGMSALAWYSGQIYEASRPSPGYFTTTKPASNPRIRRPAIAGILGPPCQLCLSPLYSQLFLCVLAFINLRRKSGDLTNYSGLFTVELYVGLLMSRRLWLHLLLRPSAKPS